MWVPRTADEVRQALAAGTLQESQTFDAKEGPPKSPDLVVDVGAMTVNGGVLLFGAGENSEKTRITEERPIELAGQRERVQNMVATGLSEAPAIVVDPLELAEDKTRGFIVVTVPPSARAPHQIILRGKYDGRFYTRDSTGNRLLGQVEIELLFQRRARWEHDIGEALREAHDRQKGPSASDRIALTVLCDPLAATGELVVAGPHVEPRIQLPSAVLQAIQNTTGRRDVGGFDGLTNWRLIHADAWGAEWPEGDRPMLRAEVTRRGRITMTSLNAGRRSSPQGNEPLLSPYYTANLTGRAVGLAGQVVGNAGYIGPVDLGVMVSPLDGARASFGTGDGRTLRGLPYRADEYVRSVRLPAVRLQREPVEVARELMAPLFEAMLGRGADPFRD